MAATIFVAVVLCSLLLLNSKAFAADVSYNTCFMTLETDGDGVVSSSEFTSVFPKGSKVFSEADTNADGELDHDEWEDWKVSQGFEDAHN